MWYELTLTERALVVCFWTAAIILGNVLFIWYLGSEWWSWLIP